MSSSGFLVGVLQAYSKRSRQLDQIEKLVNLYAAVEKVPQPESQPRRRPRRLSEQQLADVADAYESGKTVYGISAEFDIPRTMVSTHLARAGVDTQVGAAPRTIQLRLRERNVTLRDTCGR